MNQEAPSASSVLIEKEPAQKLYTRLIEMQKERLSETGVTDAFAQPLLLLCTAHWCVHCQELEEKFFSDPHFLALANHISLVKLEVTELNEEDRKILKEEFSVLAVPTICLFTEKGKELMRWNLPNKKAEAFSKEILRLCESN